MDSSQAESLALSLSKHPEVGWEEGKSTLAYAPGQFTPVYVATMKDKHQAGGQMRQVALAAGSLTIPLPSNSSCPLPQDRLKAPTGISFKNGSNSRGGLVETGACRLHARSQGCPKNQRWSHSVSSTHRSDRVKVSLLLHPLPDGKALYLMDPMRKTAEVT